MFWFGFPDSGNEAGPVAKVESRGVGGPFAGIMRRRERQTEEKKKKKKAPSFQTALCNDDSAPWPKRRERN